MSSRPSRDVDRVAKGTFGFDTLRPGQREAIESVLQGRDTLVVMSTGSGKSAIYEIAGYIKPGVTVVISPLIALQRDRIDALEERVPGEAAGVNSHVGAGARQEAMDDFGEGELEYLFLAPEQLANEEVLTQVRDAGPSLIVVDEAHCISEWGHDFRPDYLRLGAFIAEMGHPTVLALTATASPPVREEIAERLNMHDPFVVVRGFDRPTSGSASSASTRRRRSGGRWSRRRARLGNRGSSMRRRGGRPRSWLRRSARPRTTPA